MDAVVAELRLLQAAGGRVMVIGVGTRACAGSVGKVRLLVSYMPLANLSSSHGTQHISNVAIHS